MDELKLMENGNLGFKEKRTRNVIDGWIKS